MLEVVKEDCYSSKFSVVQNFREIAENHMSINFHDKNFMIAYILFVITCAAYHSGLHPQILHVMCVLCTHCCKMSYLEFQFCV